MSTSSWYRRSLWRFKGTREYTKSGYQTASNSFIEKDLDVDCSGKQYMITGANSGLGLETALEIAKRGGELHLVCRNAKSMKEARSHIITTTGNDRICQHKVNLAKPREVRRWAEGFLKTAKRLDVLINNAGCMIQERILNDDELETNFAVNTLAVHIMVTTLAPLIEKSSDGRIITVSSGRMLTVKLEAEDLNCENMNPFDGADAYSLNKRQQVVMSFAYAQRFPNIHISSMHPGWVDTPSVRTFMPDFYKTTKDDLRTPLQGADTIIWLAVSDAARKQPTGLFFQDRSPTLIHLPLAWTKSPIETEHKFMNKLDELVIKYSTFEDYFTISNVGSDIIASDSFLGQYNDNLKDVRQNEPTYNDTNSSINLQVSSDVILKQTSSNQKVRTTIHSRSSSSEDDNIIMEVENILYNDDMKKAKLQDSVIFRQNDQIERSQLSIIEKAKKDESSLQSESVVSNQEIDSGMTLKAESLINGNTSDIRKQAAIDDMLNDAFQTESLDEAK